MRDWSYCTVLVYSILSSDQPAPSPITTPAGTPHTPALVQRYIDYLKDRYINKITNTEGKGTAPPKNSFTQLVSNEAKEKEEDELKASVSVAAVWRCCCNKEEEETNGDGGHC